MAKWTEKELSLLGTDTDAAIAKKVGRNQHAVTIQRTKLGIPAAQPRGYDWTSDEDAMLGTGTDQAVADTLGVAKITIMRRRQKLGIPSFNKRKGGR